MICSLSKLPSAATTESCNSHFGILTSNSLLAHFTECSHLFTHAQGRQNIAPDKIPWAALKTLMAQSIYGGRIDNEFDQRLLITFLDRIFTKGSFDSEFKLASKVDGHKDIKMPDGIRSVVDRIVLVVVELRISQPS